MQHGTLLGPLFDPFDWLDLSVARRTKNHQPRHEDEGYDPAENCYEYIEFTLENTRNRLRFWVEGVVVFVMALCALYVVANWMIGGIPKLISALEFVLLLLIELIDSLPG